MVKKQNKKSTKPARSREVKYPTARKKTIEQYEREGKQHVNNPLVGVVTPDSHPDVKSEQPRKMYQYDPNFDHPRVNHAFD